MAEQTDESGTADQPWRPTATWARMRQRGHLTGTLREFFRAADYWEVETPVLSASVAPDADVDPFVVHFHADPADWSGEGKPYYLRTSALPQMRRLVASGAEAIVQIARVFRNGAAGGWDNPESTRVEWYRVGDDHLAQMVFVESLVRTVFADAARLLIDRTSGQTAHPVESLATAPFERLTWQAAFERYAGVGGIDAPVAELRRVANEHQLTPPPSLGEDDRDGWLGLILTGLIEPHLGHQRPTFLHDYPATRPDLAVVRPTYPGGPEVAERFELYMRGVKLCEGAHELTEEAERRQRYENEATRRSVAGWRNVARNGRAYEDLPASQPRAAGVSLDWDRVLRLALGANDVREVIPYAWERA